jgi:2-amino-4-hydroxy-6-hydroxymethyldihydropteridine diphosphokinase
MIKAINEKIISARNAAKKDLIKLPMNTCFFATLKNKDICTPESTESMNKAYLLTGGNEGDKLGCLAQAKNDIEKEAGKILTQSALYETAAWGKTDQPSFLNQVLYIETLLDASALMIKLLQVEEKMGRKRLEKYGPRIIDIDILFFNSAIINEKDLIIPHPQIQNRRFVLEPMNELSPEFMHPVLHKTIHQLLMACEDKLDVKKL